MDVFEERQTTRGEFMPLSILRAVWKQKLLIVSLWVAIWALGALVVYQLPAVYQARTVILIEHQRIPERYVASTVNEDLSNRLNRISQQILSYEPLLRLIEEFDLYADERDALVQEEVVSMMRENIDVRLVDGWAKTTAPAFQITYEGDDPSVVAQVTNRLATLFINENLRTRANQALGTQEFLTNQLEDRRREVERQEELLRDFRTRHMGELPEQQNLLLGELRRIEAELERIDAAKNRAEQNKVLYDGQLGTAQSTLEMLKRLEAQQRARLEGMGLSPSASLSAGDPTRALLREVDTEQRRLIELESRYSEQHPDVTAQRGRVTRLQAMLDEAAAKSERASVSIAGASSDGETAAAGTDDPDTLVGQSVMREMERVDKLRVQLQLVDVDLVDLDRRRSRALGEVANVEAKLGRMPMHEQELKKVSRDYGISEESYRKLLDKRLEADLASEMETRQKAERFSLLEAARLPEKPVRPDRPMLLAMVCGAGIFAGALLGFGVELRKNVILGEWEMPPDVAMLGQVPFIRFDQELSEPEAAGQSGRSTRKFQRWAIIAAALVLSVLVAAATSLYFGWISF